MPTKPDFFGKIDDHAGGFLRGWVFDRARPKRRQCVDVFAGPTFLGQTACGFYRPDLKAAGIGDGCHEFLFSLKNFPEIVAGDLYVRVAAAPNVVIRPNAPEPELLPRLPSPFDDLKSYIETLLVALTRYPPPPPRSTHPKLTTICDLYKIPLSRFAVHIASKFGYSLNNETELQAFISFYFEHYGPYNAPYRVPLTIEEKSYWGVASKEYPLGRGAERFATMHTHPATVESTYGWVVNDAARLGVDDAWIDEDAIVKLQRPRTIIDSLRAFPISNFLRLFVRNNAALHSLRFGNPLHRKFIYLAALLHSAHRPHLFKLIPRNWIEKMFEVDASNDLLIAQVLTNVIGYSPDAGIFAHIDALRSHPYVAASPQHVRALDMVDIQLIGPFDRVLGLSESCRRMARVVQSCGYTTALVNYDIDNTSPRDTSMKVSNKLSQARINILHLNLEEIPEAFAYKLEELGGSYLIAIPYFELSATAGCHKLGLDLVDEIWSPTRFLHDVFAATGKPTHLMPLPASSLARNDPHEDRAYALACVRRVDPTTVFMATADALSWIGRKNLMGVIDAFQTAFAPYDPVCLLLKTQNTELVVNSEQVALWAQIKARQEADNRIILINETIDANAYCALLAGVDCLVSLHRAEGLGFDILDAMTFGTAVVATAYSGNLDICSEETSWPVDYDLVPVGVGNYSFAEPHHLWAEPRRAAAAAVLRDVFLRPKERQRRINVARAKIEAANNPQTLAARINSRVGDILAHIRGGEATGESSLRLLRARS